MIHDPIYPETATPITTIGAIAEPTPMVPLLISPVIHPVNNVPSPDSRTFGSAVANASYIVRQNGEDLFGPLPDFAAKLVTCPDLVAHGRRGPIGCEVEGIAGLDLWRRADEAALTDRPSAPVAFHLIGWLPLSKCEDQWREIILEFLDRRVVSNGMIADWALHALPNSAGGWVKRPHMHAIVTSRFWRGPRVGQPQAAWLATKRSKAAIAEAWEQATE